MKVVEMITRLKVSEATRWTESCGGYIVLNHSTGRYFRLNRTGSYVWQSILSEHTKDSIESSYSVAFNRPIDIACRDVGQLLGQLIQFGIIKSYAIEQ